MRVEAKLFKASIHMKSLDILDKYKQKHSKADLDANGLNSQCCMTAGIGQRQSGRDASSSSPASSSSLETRSTRLPLDEQAIVAESAAAPLRNPSPL
ncbi:SubName: Full=Uncharacterized protein {ECO:0000313/EMBL:CCA72609.1} [Serendipita indica DSM 11827]|uniref:Uncharacterized protein n=1 Tax=Serendipita indica (strain DSM 11827) TaxID=1109443 RepID=G4TMR8_SERID|nr:SubName: Full=Uncharacterized protein {ECO:0000313/EMBL:CCA72609.1} [Serendipita indica DSM 11827]CCA72609.1 hypothetical protein PIIN_06546 [Serendipita indica DSM 11827]